MFCLVDIDDFSYVTVKSTPDEIDEITMNRTSVSKPLNLNERHWIQLDLNGDILDQGIYRLVRRAYDIVRAKFANFAPILK